MKPGGLKENRRFRFERDAPFVVGQGNPVRLSSRSNEELTSSRRIGGRAFHTAQESSGFSDAAILHQ